MINWPAFTPLQSLLGGLLIGLAAALLLLFNGRIAGISGIVGGLFNARRQDIVWRVVFIAGLLVAPLLYRVFHPLPDVNIEAGKGTILLAGLLVGIGTRYASGCTSGHGVCGLARLSPRSLVATAVFMVTAGLTVFILRHGVH